MTSQHTGKFTWGVGPQKVCVAGNFNNWSGDATPLHRLDDGSFAADVPLPWGEKQAFKYVVDGEWKVREDEAKEWDAAGNMNNVYTAPHAPARNETAPAAASAAAVPAASAKPAPIEKAPAPSPGETHTNPIPPVDERNVEKAPIPSPGETHTNPIPPVKDLTVEKAPVPSPGPTNTDPFDSTSRSEPSAQLVGGATTATRSGPVPVVLGNVLGGGASSATSTSASTFSTKTVQPTHAPNTDLASASPAHTAPVVDSHPSVAIEKVAANANIGQEATDHEKSILEKAQEYGLGAATTIGAALGQAAHAVEDATGLHLTQGDPMTVEEARAKGIDVDRLEKTDGPTDAISPVGQAPPAAAVADLEKKVQELKVADSGISSGPTAASNKTVAPSNKNVAAVPLPGGQAPKTMTAPSSDLPGPPPKDDKVKHDLPAQTETGENHTSIPMPVITAISDRDPAKDRTVDAPFAPDTAGTKPISSDPAIDPKVAKKEAEQNPALTGSTTDAAKKSPNTNLGVATNRPDAPETNHDAPAPVKKDVAPGEATPAPVAKDAPGTPVKSVAAVNGANGTTSSPSTPVSTPAKSTHGKEASSASDVKKRKSGFFQKMKTAFSPKHKEKE